MSYPDNISILYDITPYMTESNNEPYVYGHGKPEVSMEEKIIKKLREVERFESSPVPASDTACKCGATDGICNKKKTDENTLVNDLKRKNDILIMCLVFLTVIIFLNMNSARQHPMFMPIMHMQPNVQQPMSAPQPV